MSRYRFHMRRIEGDTSGYFYPRWDIATPITVIAATESEARSKAAAMSPKLKAGWAWLFTVDRVEEITEETP